MKTFLRLLSLLGLALLLVACAEGAPDSPALSAPTTAGAKQPATTVPQNMPTAAPLWTATPVPAAAGKTPAAASPVPGKPADQGVAATVNGTPIPRADYENQLAQAQAQFLKQPGLDVKSQEGQQALAQLQEQVLTWMIDQVVIEQAAAASKISVGNDKVEAEIARMRGSDQARFDAWLANNGLTLVTLRRQVRMDLLTDAVRDSVTASLPRKTLQIHTRHILTSGETEARTALAAIRKGTSFVNAAKQYSEDETTRQQGGDLGFMPRGVMPPAFETVAFKMTAGEVSDVVRSEFGFHVIQLVEIDQNRQVSDELWPVVQQRAFDEWLTAQRAKATIRR
jgi:peptidyl-prolyl cis-trans isomerase C/foldase protein PrsA